jgi:5,5'-dehydrodivanillate O-demethylase oxygenase subunit
MLTKEANERLTRVGPGTPMGNLMRRYWHAIATAAELDREPVLPVKILGENLALYRSPNGELGLTAERCPHRGASMVYGIPEDGGLRCPYHGWKFSNEGTCLEQPAEPANSTFKHRVRIPAYPVQELGGLIWAYLGPEPVPLLPRWDILVSDEYERKIGISHLPCNWLQPMENSMDPIHFEWLHAVYGNYVQRKQGKPETMTAKKHLRIAFDEFEFGISKRRLLEGDTEDSDDWTVGHPVIFPAILAVGDSTRPSFQIRVPRDDTSTLHFWYRAVPRQPDAPIQTSVPIYDYPHVHENGKIVVETVQGQDMMAWITQGEISDRSTERLGNSDKGVILYRSLLMREMEKVARGEDPLGVLRVPAKNDPMIRIPREGHALRAFEVNRDLIAVNLKALTGSEV